MTEDTKRALEIIKPIADELNITVDADEKLLYVNDFAIGIAMNSTFATLKEFIGVLIIGYDKYFRRINLDEDQMDIIKRYWITPELLKKISAEKGEEA